MRYKRTSENANTSVVLKWITGSLELALCVPVLSWVFVTFTGYIPLILMAVMHLITHIVTVKQGGRYEGSGVGFVASLLGAIPVVGFLLHLLAAFTLIASAKGYDVPTNEEEKELKREAKKRKMREERELLEEIEREENY